MHEEMFEASPDARVFHVPLGLPFAETFVKGLWLRAGANPVTLAKSEIYLPNARMLSEIAEVLRRKGATLLPQLKLVSDVALDPRLTQTLPLMRSPTERKLLLAQLIGKLGQQTGALASQSARFSLASSLDALLSEFQRAGLPYSAIQTLDLSNYAQHWTLSQKFLDVIAEFLDDADVKDPAARLRWCIERAAQHWTDAPPDHPIIIAGSTGSREDTLELMKAVSVLPQGAVVFPGHDEALPRDIFKGLALGKWSADHPQSVLAQAIETLGGATSQRWTPEDRKTARGALVSLALTPAPVTDRWSVEGPKLIQSIAEATDGLSFLQAATPREEAIAIALHLRATLEDDRSAVLITPDRVLARQVASQLRRWSIVPDDSAGRPLSQTPEGVFLRLILRVVGKRPETIDMVALLKHPLVFSGTERGDHLLRLRSLEAQLLRSHSPIFDAKVIRDWIAKNQPSWTLWWEAISSWCEEAANFAAGSLDTIVEQHKSLAENLTKIDLWASSGGTAALAALDDLASAQEAAGQLTLSDYTALFQQSFTAVSVRETVRADTRIAIWGTLEARNTSRDLVILGGLNEGVWPELPSTDPWLNRPMRKAVGLSPLERTIGLAAHDFQQAISAKTVVLSRSLRDGDAPTVPSRWVMRFTNLLNGLGEKGEQALAQMEEKARPYLLWARELEAAQTKEPKAARPSPAPPLAARLNKLPVTQIQNLIRDPYAVYARYVLNFRKLDPLGRGPDMRLRGSALHEVMERFAKNSEARSMDVLMKIADAELRKTAPWPISFHQWRARIARSAEWIVDYEEALSQTEVVVTLEKEGAVHFPEVNFTLTAKPDRINSAQNGLRIIDYKTSQLPTDKTVRSFDKQLPLTKLVAEKGGFPELGHRSAFALTYVSLAGHSRDIDPDIAELSATEEKFLSLIRSYQSLETGFTARTRPKHIQYSSDYDQLSRFGEWADGDPFIVEMIL